MSNGLKELLLAAKVLLAIAGIKLTIEGLRASYAREKELRK